MTRPAPNKPNVEAVMRDLKDFQRRTVEHAFRRLYLDPDSTHRFLVADEVGLGKTLVAKGVIAKAVDHLWDRVERVDIVYVCSNAEIARQNINRLRLDAQHEFARATRATLLPVELHNLAEQRVNFVSMTPGTSLDPAGGTGIMQERALLFRMLIDHWGFRESAGLRVLRCAASFEGFERCVNGWLGEQSIDAGLRSEFLRKLDEQDEVERAAGRKSLRDEFGILCELLPRRDSTLDVEQHATRRRLVGDLRAILGKACINSLSPDLVILDEFQRFKHLLDPESEDAELARSLFEYADDREGRSEAARVLLLSATPYKMYTLEHERDGGEGHDHYADFIATYDFLVRHQAEDVEALRGLLKALRSTILSLGRETTDELRRIKSDLQTRLRKVMSRTERLAVTEDRGGMLREHLANSLHLDDEDIQQYLHTSRVARALDQDDITEYWKSAPYLMNFMDEYALKNALNDALNGDSTKILDAVQAASSSLLQWKDVQSYSRIDPANSRLRSLMADTLDSGLWKTLWLPPSHPYYRLSGAFEGLDPIATTKRLVFSSWKVVPKVIAAVLSHEAERRAMGMSHQQADGSMAIENSPDGRKRIAALLQFSRSAGRLTGMPVLGLVYPSITLARELDPAAFGSSDSGVPPVDDLIGLARMKLEPLLNDVVIKYSRESETDESWYWAAPILLDVVFARNASDRFWKHDALASEWAGDYQQEADSDDDRDMGEDVDQTGWEEHLDQARSIYDGAVSFIRRKLGRPPEDLLDFIAQSAIGNPAVAALRALSRVAQPDGGAANGQVTDVQTRLAAGRVAWRIRNLFNVPEVISIVRGQCAVDPYWRGVIAYCIDGCIQSVLDEYAHVLRQNVGTTRIEPSAMAVEIADGMVKALGLRAAAVGVDEITVNTAESQLNIVPRRMRSRFAVRYVKDKSGENGDIVRTEHVQAAFNSPFWPFVLATTSVGQEGLDFHHYCHAVVHWNLPANPVDLEQREGRVHRFKGHAIRKNVALVHGAPVSEYLTDPWRVAFERAVHHRSDESNELVPFWVFPHEGGASIERHVPALPLSRDADRLIRLRSTLAVYRMVFGQPRQDELMQYLLTEFSPDLVDHFVRELQINLEPPSQFSTLPDFNSHADPSYAPTTK